MTDQEPASQPEKLLQAWLAEDDQESARALMSIVVGKHAEPLIRRIVSVKLASAAAGGRPGIPAADVDDVCRTLNVIA